MGLLLQNIKSSLFSHFLLSWTSSNFFPLSRFGKLNKMRNVVTIKCETRDEQSIRCTFYHRLLLFTHLLASSNIYCNSAAALDFPICI